MSTRYLHKLAQSAAWFVSGRYRSGGALAYVGSKEGIPEILLPGRFLMKQPADVRESLARLTSDDHLRTAPWAVRALIG